MFGYSLTTLVVFFGSALFLAYLFLRGTFRLQRLGAFFTAALIAIFYGSRGSMIGIDTAEYIGRYKDGIITQDYLFCFLSTLAQQFGLSASAYLILIALLSSLLLLFALKNFTNSYSKATLFLLLIVALPYGIMSYVNIIRQGLAVSLVLFGLSMIYIKKPKSGYISSVLSVLVHRWTGIMYILSVILRKINKLRFGPLVVAIFSVSMLILAAHIPQLIALLGGDASTTYDGYKERDTSESPLLIYAKVGWAVLHLGILIKLNKSKEIFQPLYFYYCSVVLMTIILISNPLVSSRFLSSIDFILPVVYAAYGGQKKGLYIVGLVLLITYAVISPFIFQIYPKNLGW